MSDTPTFHIVDPDGDFHEFAGDPVAALNAGYRERAHLVALLAADYPSYIGHTDPAEPDWAVVTVELPTGQACWHIAPADMDLFRHVRIAIGRDRPWDGHSTEEKYRRIADLARSRSAAPVDFFQAGKTYIEAKPFTAPEALTVFRCIAVDQFPGHGGPAGDLLALGFATDASRDDHWNFFLCRQEAWAEGWTEYDTTPRADQ